MGRGETTAGAASLAGQPVGQASEAAVTARRPAETGIEERGTAGDTGPAGRLLSAVAAIARDLGDSAAAGRLLGEAGSLAGQTARVAVVGEKKRGKSSLINALLRRPGLLPVDIDIATSVHVSVQSADAASARAVRDGDPAGREIPLAQVAEYAALDPVTADMRHPDVRQVIVGLPDPLLGAGLVLIDTPGVGGLVSGHAELTLAALRQADALVFVLDGSGEITASELAFLTRASERAGTVLFAVTQIDKHPRWRDVLRRDQALIAEHAPELAGAPWFPVSSRLRLDAVLAGQAGDAGRAVELDERSGFAALEEALNSRVAGRAGQLRAAGAAWLARRTVDALIAAQEQRLRSLQQDRGLIDACSAQRTRLMALAGDRAPWRSTLADGFTRLGRELGRRYQRQLADLQITADGWAAEAGGPAATPDRVAHDLRAGVQALWADLETAAVQGALAVAAQAAAGLAEAGIEADLGGPPTPAQLTELPGLVLTRDEAKPGLVGVLYRYFPGVSMTSFVGHAMFAMVNPYLLLPLGVAVGHALYQRRKAQEETAQVRSDVYRHIRAVITQVTSEMPGALQDALEALHTELTAAITAQIAERERELNETIAEGLRNLEASQQQLAPQRAAAEQALRQLRSLAAVADRLIEEAAPPGPGPGAGGGV